MRKKQLSALKQMKLVSQLRDEVADMLSMSQRGVERLTKEFAPLARQGGGTESDVLVLLHRIVHHQAQRPSDFDYILGSTFSAVDDLTLKGVHGLPLKSMIRDTEPLVGVCIGICDLLWTQQWTKHKKEVERRNLQIDHARMSATAFLSSQAAPLEEVRARMQELGVEPDPELEADARRQRDAQGIPAPPWEK